MAVVFVRSLACGCAASLLAVVLAGCHVSSKKNGKNENVDIGTPFGSMSVKTNESVSSVGLSAYPGASEVKDDKDNSSADVNLDFGKFHLGVKAMSYQTSDAPDKVIAFYRNDLKRYGDVIQCKGRSVVGTPARTAQGLNCEESDKNHINASGSGSEIELRAGSPKHQHIVGVERKDGGTRIGLVMLDLPGETDVKSEKESQ